MTAVETVYYGRCLSCGDEWRDRSGQPSVCPECHSLDVEQREPSAEDLADRIPERAAELIAAGVTIGRSWRQAREELTRRETPA